jgi:alpha-tubulin suppressor-like RCC1 family protein
MSELSHFFRQEMLMLRGIRIRGLTPAAARVLLVCLLCVACESQKTLEPVRPSAIAATSSGTLQGIVSAALADDVVVRVVDQRGNPMRGAQVTWTAAEGTITPSSVTDDNGEARARWTLGPTLGSQVASAKTASFSTQITATATGIWRTIQLAYTGGCGLTKSNSALCWGANDAGQLGTGATSATRTLIPTPVSTSQKFQELRMTYAHTCGVISQGTAFCWGLNGNGQVGVSKSTTPNCPTASAPCMVNIAAVPGAPAFTSITLGFYHTCGLSAGKAYCWGRNNEGQLGIGTIDANEHASPTPVVGGLTFLSISAGFTYTCGVTTGGQGYCWGSNSRGELGIGSFTPTGTPAPVAGNLAFASISAGSGFTTCGITATQSTYCWGWNDSGQLGTPDVTDTVSVAPVRVSGSQVFASVSPSNFHACGVATNGTAYCWGSGPDGELGIGTQTPPHICGATFLRCSRTPLAVSGGYSFTSISANNFNTCGITTLGGAFCWGFNDNGQFGNGTTTRSDVPIQMSNPKGIPLP